MLGSFVANGIRRSERTAAREGVVQRALARVGEANQAEAFHSEGVRLAAAISAPADVGVDLCDVKRILAVVFVALLVSVPGDGRGRSARHPDPVELRRPRQLRRRCRICATTTAVPVSRSSSTPPAWPFRRTRSGQGSGCSSTRPGSSASGRAPSTAASIQRSTRRRRSCQQQFPNDPTGAKGAYLTWGYGDTTDNLTAAAMWAVFHYYAQDAAGTRRAVNGEAPLIPSLDMVARASGRDGRPAAGDRVSTPRPRQFAGEWVIAATVDLAGQIDVTVFAGTQPVLGAPCRC